LPTSRLFVADHEGYSHKRGWIWRGTQRVLDRVAFNPNIGLDPMKGRNLFDAANKEVLVRA